ncbi:MAG TPA: TIM barrel protein [Thermoleophilaceae bacterium]|nr:TIM barrel protein [Thermoleophilaceae bacterium]
MVRVGPSYLPSQDNPAAAVEWLAEHGFTACEIDFERKFWMDYAFAERLGELAGAADIALSVHAPLAAFVGRPERDKKFRTAVGMLDHTAGLTAACGADLMVVHPGYLFGRAHTESVRSVVEQLSEVRERLETKGRGVTFGIEVMGRVRELGTLDDVIAIAARLDWVRPVIDFAHLHAVTDGGFTNVTPFEEALRLADGVIEPGAPFHIHFSDISYANRNEKWHLPYGEGTLRAEPLAEALASFRRPATVISESPDTQSDEAVKAILTQATRSSPRG